MDDGGLFGGLGTGVISPALGERPSDHGSDLPRPISKKKF